MGILGGFRFSTLSQGVGLTCSSPFSRGLDFVPSPNMWGIFFISPPPQMSNSPMFPWGEVGGWRRFPVTSAFICAVVLTSVRTYHLGVKSTSFVLSIKFHRKAGWPNLANIPKIRMNTTEDNICSRSPWIPNVHVYTKPRLVNLVEICR